jgi:hypothetical protein
LNNQNNLWPRQPDNTNFRMAKVDYNQDQQTNLGHSEYQLLHGDGLRIMRQGMGDCPRFMIIYSTNLPCMRPRYGPGHLVPNRADRCLEIIGAARRTLRNDCPNAFFYLFTHQARARSPCDRDQRFFQWERDYLRDNNIIWLHP